MRLKQILIVCDENEQFTDFDVQKLMKQYRSCLIVVYHNSSQGVVQIVDYLRQAPRIRWSLTRYVPDSNKQYDVVVLKGMSIEEAEEQFASNTDDNTEWVIL